MSHRLRLMSFTPFLVSRRQYDDKGDHLDDLLCGLTGEQPISALSTSRWAQRLRWLDALSPEAHFSTLYESMGSKVETYKPAGQPPQFQHSLRVDGLKGAVRLSGVSALMNFSTLYESMGSKAAKPDLERDGPYISALSTSRWAQRRAGDGPPRLIVRFQHSLRVDGLKGRAARHVVVAKPYFSTLYESMGSKAGGSGGGDARRVISALSTSRWAQRQLDEMSERGAV